MSKVVTYSLIENGYDLYVSVDEGTPTLALHQPEPFIIHRVLNDDGTTDYEASAQAHATAFEEEMNKEVEEQKTLAELQTEVTDLETQLTDTQLALCEQYEENIVLQDTVTSLQEEVTYTQLALVELYESMYADEEV